MPVGIEWGATKRGRSRHLLLADEAICGSVDAHQLDAARCLDRLPVCANCALTAAALHAAAVDG